jgi:sulfur carrier protein ThiS
MIQIDLKFAGYFSKFRKEGKDYIKISLKNPSIIRDILMNFGIDFRKITVRPIIIVNGHVYTLDYVVKDGDEVILMNMIFGG